MSLTYRVELVYECDVEGCDCTTIIDQADLRKCPKTGDAVKAALLREGKASGWVVYEEGIVFCKEHAEMRAKGQEFFLKD